MVGVCLKYNQRNYGSKLQALATVKVLEEMGLDYEILRYNKDLAFYIKSLPRFFNIVFLNDWYDYTQKKIEFKKHSEVKEKIDLRNKRFSEFDEYFNSHLSENFSNYKALKAQAPERYSALLTCSDQLWSPSALGSGFYNLMFASDNQLKISWASSFGVGKIPWYQISRTREYLKRIEYVSMRENRGAEIVKELTDRDVPVLMDPVFVFDKEKWEQLIPKTENKYGDYIFCYFLGNNLKYREYAASLAQRENLKILTLPHLDRYVKEDELQSDLPLFDITPQEFLNIIRNARYVLTDSFHGAAFSVICEKQFLVLDRYNSTSKNSKNSRIETLCDNLGLTARRYSGEGDICESIKKPIDYKSVCEKSEVYRNKTLCYLKAAFGDQAKG